MSVGAASSRHAFGDRSTARRVLAKTERVQELVNHDDLGRTPDGVLLGVPVSFEGASFQPGKSTKLVERRYYMGDGSMSGRTYDVAPDGKKFLMIQDASGAEAATPHLVVVLDWVEELKRLVPR